MLLFPVSYEEHEQELREKAGGQSVQKHRGCDERPFEIYTLR